MDKAFVEHSQHEIDDQYGNEQKYAKTALRTLECGCRPLITKSNGVGHPDLTSGFVNQPRRFIERDSRLHIELEIHSGKLSDVIYAERRDGRLQLRHRGQWNHLSLIGTNVEIAQGCWIALVLGQNFQKHVVLVRRRLDCGHSTITVGVVKCIRDRIGGYSKCPCPVAIDINIQTRAVQTQITVNVGQLWNGVQLRLQY